MFEHELLSGIDCCSYFRLLYELANLAVVPSGHQSLPKKVDCDDPTLAVTREVEVEAEAERPTMLEKVDKDLVLPKFV